MEKEKIIIEEAKKMFTQIGYKATTMELLANKINIGKGTLYLYFDSKEELLKAIVKELISYIDNKATEIEQMDISFNEKIMLFIKEMVKFKNEQKMVAKLVYEAEEVGSIVVKKYIKQIEDYIIEIIKSKIDVAIKNKYIENCDSKFKAFLIYKIYVILVLEWEEENKKIDEKELYRMLENIFK